MKIVNGKTRLSNSCSMCEMNLLVNRISIKSLDRVRLGVVSLEHSEVNLIEVIKW